MASVRLETPLLWLVTSFGCEPSRPRGKGPTTLARLGPRAAADLSPASQSLQGIEPGDGQIFFACRIRSPSAGGHLTDRGCPPGISRSFFHVAGADKITDDLEFLVACDGMGLHEFMPLDLQAGGFEHVHLLAHRREGDERIESSMCDEKTLLQGDG